MERKGMRTEGKGGEVRGRKLKRKGGEGTPQIFYLD